MISVPEAITSGPNMQLASYSHMPHMLGGVWKNYQSLAPQH